MLGLILIDLELFCVKSTHDLSSYPGFSDFVGNRLVTASLHALEPSPCFLCEHLSDQLLHRDVYCQKSS
jgi:hypothetical protein